MFALLPPVFSLLHSPFWDDVSYRTQPLKQIMEQVKDMLPCTLQGHERIRIDVWHGILIDFSHSTGTMMYLCMSQNQHGRLIMAMFGLHVLVCTLEQSGCCGLGAMLKKSMAYFFCTVYSIYHDHDYYQYAFFRVRLVSGGLA